MAVTEISQWTTHQKQHAEGLCEWSSLLLQYQRLKPREVHAGIGCKKKKLPVVSINYTSLILLFFMQYRHTLIYIYGSHSVGIANQ